MVLRAAHDGMLRFSPPEALAGELEVFGANDLLAVIDGDVRVEIRAPADGFVLRRCAPEGVPVARGAPLLEFRIA